MPSNLDDKSRRRSIGFSHAWNGLLEMVKNERNFQVHLLVTVLIVIVGVIVRFSAIEWMIIFLVIGVVLVAETTNTAIEKLIDYLKPDIHPSAKVIKDMAAGAVLIAAIMAIIIGCMIIIPKLYTLLM